MDSVSFFWSFVKMLASLAIVIGLMIVAMILMKKYFFQSPSSCQSGDVINILASRPLGPKSSLMIVEALGKVVLVSSSNQQITALATIDDPAAVEKLKNLQFQRPGGQVDPLAPIKDLFRRSVRKGR